MTQNSVSYILLSNIELYMIIVMLSYPQIEEPISQRIRGIILIPVFRQVNFKELFVVFFLGSVVWAKLRTKLRSMSS